MIKILLIKVLIVISLFSCIEEKSNVENRNNIENCYDTLIEENDKIVFFEINGEEFPISTFDNEDNLTAQYNWSSIDKYKYSITEFDTNGIIRSICQYKGTELHGRSFYYDSKGHLRMIKEFKEGNQIDFFFYSPGKVDLTYFEFLSEPALDKNDKGEYLLENDIDTLTIYIGNMNHENVTHRDLKIKSNGEELSVDHVDKNAFAIKVDTFLHDFELNLFITREDSTILADSTIKYNTQKMESDVFFSVENK